MGVKGTSAGKTVIIKKKSSSLNSADGFLGGNRLPQLQVHPVKGSLVMS